MNIYTLGYLAIAFFDTFKFIAKNNWTTNNYINQNIQKVCEDTNGNGSKLNGKIIINGNYYEKKVIDVFKGWKDSKWNLTWDPYTR